jgi:ELWxxDGT repeat protein
MLYFVAKNGLWRSDGTAAGTFAIKTFPGLHGDLNQLTVVGDVVYFTAEDDEHGRELWRSDGTPEGTILVEDVVPGSQSSYPDYLAPVGNVLYFVTHLEGGEQLWRATAAGAEPVPVPEGVDDYEKLFAVGTTLYFYTEDDLWVLLHNSQGDYDSDADADGADFLIWQRTLGAAPPQAGGGADGNQDGVVNAADLGVWRGRFAGDGNLASTVAARVVRGDRPPAAIDATFEELAVRGDLEQLADAGAPSPFTGRLVATSPVGLPAFRRGAKRFEFRSCGTATAVSPAPLSATVVAPRRLAGATDEVASHSAHGQFGAMESEVPNAFDSERQGRLHAAAP